MPKDPEVKDCAMFDRRWNPSSEVALTYEAFVPVLCSILANTIPAFMERVPGLIILGLLHTVCVGLLLMPICSANSALGRRVGSTVSAFLTHEFGSPRVLRLFLATHVLIGVQNAIVLAAGERARVLQLNGDGSDSNPLDLFLYPVWVGGLVAVQFIAAAFSFTNWKHVPKGASIAPSDTLDTAEGSAQDDAAVAEVGRGAGSSTRKSRRLSCGRLFVTALSIFGASVALVRYFYVFAKHSLPPIPAWLLVVGIMGSFTLLVGLLVLVHLTLNMVDALQAAATMTEQLSTEPLAMQRVTPAVLNEWWERRSVVVHKQLPILFFKVAWMVAFLCTCAFCASVYSLGRIIGSKASAMNFDVLVMLFVTVVAAIGVLGFLDSEVNIYKSAQHSQRIMFMLAHRLRVQAAEQVEATESEAGELKPSRETTEQSLSVLDGMQTLTQFDPFASVFGIPVKPAFRNIVVGYLVSAAAAVAGKFAIG